MAKVTNPGQVQRKGTIEPFEIMYNKREPPHWLESLVQGQGIRPAQKNHQGKPIQATSYFQANQLHCLQLETGLTQIYLAATEQREKV
ncbi:uncharacterized protein CIMG_13202 [Coccidioides immitis RS]|uniref:Uncharacterized protein n=1 Tax=Coccidioides immitis (strain RS) TaxID=246410 RepID=A0A0E1RVE7_COCIM|nr:uncharacterized protein CIMG_13202 [Coccidioides immitis RS]EAS29692.2 hypothetical protein CIMG_13202 [Coccidioides immitis RS]